MQSLLRAGKTKAACQCRSCLTVVKTSIRQISTGPGARKPTLTEVVTGCYTAAFGTFAVLDAKVKDERRDDLESQIDQTKSTIAALQAENARLMAKHADKIMVDENGEIVEGDPDARWGSNKVFVPDSTSHDPAYLHWDETQSKMFDIFRSTDYWKTLPVIKRSNYKRMRQWIVDDAAQNPQSTTYSDLELSTKEREVASFVRSILGPSNAVASTNYNENDTLRVQIETLLEQDFPKFSNTSAAESQETDKTLSDYLVRGVENNREFTVENICFNLLVSPIVPSGNTLDSLLLKLSEAGYHGISEELVQNVQSHFKNYTKNFTTAICMLNHSKEAGRLGLTYHYIKRIMQWETGSGSHLLTANRLTNQGRYLWETIVKSLMGLYKFQDAVDVLCKALILGITVNAWVIIQLFTMCIYRLDRELATNIVRSLSNSPSVLSQLFQRENHIQSIILHQLRYLITISGLEGRTFKDHAAIFQQFSVNPEGFEVLNKKLQEYDLRLQTEQSDIASARLQNLYKSGDHDAVDRTMDDFNFHWAAASPHNWVTRNLDLEWEDGKFTKFTYQEYIAAQRELRMMISMRATMQSLRESQKLVLETEETLESLSLGVESETTSNSDKTTPAKYKPMSQDDFLAQFKSLDVEGKPVQPIPAQSKRMTLEPYMPAWAEHVERRKGVMERWMRTGNPLPLSPQISADAMIQKKVALLESLQKNLPGGNARA